jgi:hypothetical protein
VNWASELLFSPSGAVCAAAAGWLREDLASANWATCWSAALLTTSVLYVLRGYTTMRESVLDHLAWLVSPGILALIGWGEQAIPLVLAWMLWRFAVRTLGSFFSSPSPPELLEALASEKLEPGRPRLNILIAADAVPPKVRETLGGWPWMDQRSLADGWSVCVCRARVRRADEAWA